MKNLFSKSDDGFRLVEQLFDGVMLAAPNPWHVVYANSAAANWIGVEIQGLVRRPIADLFVPAARETVMKCVESVSCGEKSDDLIFASMLAVVGGTLAVEVRLCRVVVDGTSFVGIIFHAAGQRKDPLTGIPDRDFLMSRLTELLRAGRTEHERFAVLFVDLDNFKDVNDRRGHLMGDIVLREAARRLADCLPEGDHVVRYGGDEFVVLLEHVADANAVRGVIDGIAAAIAKPIALPDGEVTLSLSVGVAMASPELRTPEEMLAAADRAMYAAKRSSV